MQLVSRALYQLVCHIRESILRGTTSNQWCMLRLQHKAAYTSAKCNAVVQVPTEIALSVVTAAHNAWKIRKSIHAFLYTCLAA